jgi:hypothetical protein
VNNLCVGDGGFKKSTEAPFAVPYRFKISARFFRRTSRAVGLENFAGRGPPLLNQRRGIYIDGDMVFGYKELCCVKQRGASVVIICVGITRAPDC